MRVVVFGATGYVGRNIVAELSERGHDVVPVSRSGAEGKNGSVFDRDFVDHVAAEGDVIVSALPAFLDDDKDVGDAIAVLLDVAAVHGSRLAGVGGAAALPLAEGQARVADGPDVPEIVQRLTEAHDHALENLEASPAEVDWFYLIPPLNFGPQAPGERTGEYRVNERVLIVGSDGESRISGADYAVAFVDELERPQHHRRPFTVGY